MHKQPAAADHLSPSEIVPPEIIAAVDLGSNSFHMIVGELRHGQLAILDRIRETVRLAEGLSPNGDLRDDARERAIACLSRFGERLRDMRAGNVRAAGTSTIRRAREDSTFMGEAEAALGHPIEIISGIEEARLIYKGVTHSLPPAEGLRLVMDIGGGSTELILGQASEPKALESLDMGCVSMTERFFADGKFYHTDGKARMLPITAPTLEHKGLTLNTGRNRDQWHTMTRTGKSPKLGAHLAEPYLEIHPDDAAEVGTSHGDLVAVETAQGSAILRSLVTDRVARGQLFAPMHWTRQTARGAVVNTLERLSLCGQVVWFHGLRAEAAGHDALCRNCTHGDGVAGRDGSA